MKLLPAVASIFLLNAGAAAAQECPNSIDLGAWGEEKLDGTDLIFRHAVVLASTPNERDILCGRLEYVGDSYLAWAISPTGQMVGDAVIGLPGSDSVRKYNLPTHSTPTEMSADKQTLMDTSITQDEGGTVMAFSKYLDEGTDGEQVINPNGANIFLWALGTSNNMGYHGGSKGSFKVTFDATKAPTSSETIAPSPQMSGEGSDSGGSEELPEVPVIRTIAPVPVPVGREPASTPAPVDPTPPPPTPGSPPTPAAPTEQAPEPSGAMGRKIAEATVLGVGVAVWMGL